MKIVLTGIIIFAVYSFVTIRYYVCEIMEFCDEEVVMIEDVTPEPEFEEIEEMPSIESKGNLVFDKANEIPFTDHRMVTFKDSIRDILTENTQRLLITGKYFSDEQNETTYDNLGLARANAVKALFSEEDFYDRLDVSASLESGSVEDIVMPFKAVDFDISENDEIEDEFAVTSLDNKVIVNFPVASADPAISSSLNESLDKLAEEVIASGATLIITGHTDNSGSSEKNYTYGLARAEAIREMLILKNVSASRIKVESKGETEPIADNSTEIGKRKNRRVEIEVN